MCSRNNRKGRAKRSFRPAFSPQGASLGTKLQRPMNKISVCLGCVEQSFGVGF